MAPFENRDPRAAKRLTWPAAVAYKPAVAAGSRGPAGTHLTRGRLHALAARRGFDLQRTDRPDVLRDHGGHGRGLRPAGGAALLFFLALPQPRRRARPVHPRQLTARGDLDRRAGGDAGVPG